MAAALRLALACGFACFTLECAALARFGEADTSLGRREDDIFTVLADDAALLIQVIASTARDARPSEWVPEEEHRHLDLAINDRPRRRRRSQKDSGAEEDSDSSAAAAQPDEAGSQNATLEATEADDQPADDQIAEGEEDAASAEDAENSTRPTMYGGYGEAAEPKDKQGNVSANATKEAALLHSEGKANGTTDEDAADDEEDDEEDQSQLVGRPGRTPRNITRVNRSLKKTKGSHNQTAKANATAQEEPKAEEAGHTDAAKKESEEKEGEAEEVSDAKKDAFEQVVNQTIARVMNNRSNTSSAAGSNLTSVENKTAPDNGTTFGALEEAVKQAVTEASVNPGEAKAFTEVADKALAKVAAGALEAAVQDANVSNASTHEPQERRELRAAKEAMEEAEREPSKMEIVKEIVKKFVKDAPNDPDKMKTLEDTGIWSLGKPEAIKEKVENAQKTADTEKSGDEVAGNVTSNTTKAPAQGVANITSSWEPSSVQGEHMDKAAVNEAVDKALALQQKTFDQVVDKVVERAVVAAVEKVTEAAEKVSAAEEGREEPA